MDIVIRGAQVADRRSRLKLGEPMPGGGQADPPIPAADTRASTRLDMERVLRAELLAESRALLDADRQRARSEGHAEGLAAARLAAASELRDAESCRQAEYVRALAALERGHRELHERLEQQVGEVAFAAVCHVAGAQAVSREFVLGIVAQACAALRSEPPTTLRLHPRDAKLLQAQAASASDLGGLGMSLVADESLTLGGCVVESASGSYDASLKTQLGRLHAVLVATGVEDRSCTG